MMRYNPQSNDHLLKITFTFLWIKNKDYLLSLQIIIIQNGVGMQRMMAQKVNLAREDFSSNVSRSVQNLVKDQVFTDVTLVCGDNQQIKAHKVILGSTSTFFKTVLTVNSHQHPLIFLKGVKHERLKQIIDFIYIGEINIEPVSYTHLTLPTILLV